MWLLRLCMLLLCGTSLYAVAPPPGSCPKQCKCSSRGRRVSCENHKLRKIPSNIPFSVTELYLGSNLLDSLPADSFRNLTELHTLSLNRNLLTSSSVDVNAFRGLTNLRYLFMTNNKLEQINKEVFADLTGLQRLYLSQNMLKEIPDLGYCVSLSKLGIDNNRLTNAQFPASFSNLTALSTLVLSNNPQLTKFTYEDVKSLLDSQIRKINLGRCNIQKVDVETFTAFPHLNSLDLSYNNNLDIEEIRNIINGLQHSELSYLGLSSVIRTSLIPPDLFVNFTQVPLHTLDMSHMEKVSIIENNTFKYLVNLEYLDLSYSKLILIADGVFGDVGMKLTRLNLAYNDIAVVPKGLPTSLEILDLSNNGVDQLFQEQFGNLYNLQNLSLAYCKIKTVSQDAFVGVSGLVSLDMSHNRIGGNNIGNKVFLPLINLRSLNLRGNLMNDISTQFKLFAQLTNLIELDMSDNRCSNLDRNIFSNQTLLKKLDLSQNELGDYIHDETGLLFSPLKNLETLSMDQSGLYELPTMLFSNLVSLKQLHLHDNNIAEWDGGLFVNTKNLSEVNLSQNNIAVINETSVRDLPDKVELDLTKNPFACWCDLIWFRNWLDEEMNTSRISLPGNETYLCHSPKSMLNRKVLDFHPLSIQEECTPPPWVNIIIGVSVGITGLMTGLVLVIYKNRWSIQLRIYKMRKRFAANKAHRSGYVAIPGDDQQPSYDICVSYGPSRSDCKWVRQKLIPHIDKTEGGKWSVFVEERDAMPNRSTIGQISEAIYSSRKIILILSNEYIGDSRREYEVLLVFSAMEELGLRGEDTIIPILLEENVNVKVPRLLHPIFKANLELSWTENSESGQDLFWNQLDDRMRSDMLHGGNIQV